MSKPWQRWKTPAIRAVKLVLAALIVGMVARSLGRAWGDLRAYGASIRPEPAWLGASGLLYLLGLSCNGVFFTRIMAASDTPVGLFAAMRAYLIGHLGKYVPGKALVVVIRVALVVPHGARAASAAFATLYETLVMMASGALLAGSILLAKPGPPIAVPIGVGRSLGLPLGPLGLAIGLPLLVLAAPRVFPRLALAVSVPFPGVGPDALPRFSGRLLLEGLCWSLLGWTLLGSSLVATLRAIDPGGAVPGVWAPSVAASALATVSGFLVAIFPGGLLIREAVLAAALGPIVGAEPAIVAALVLRLVWVVAELLAAGILAIARPKAARRPDPAAVLEGTLPPSSLNLSSRRDS